LIQSGIQAHSGTPASFWPVEKNIFNVSYWSNGKIESFFSAVVSISAQ